MKHLDLFSGIGGFALACQWNGIETIGFVEIDKYCQKVLKKHWPDVPIVEDIRDVEKIKELAINVSDPAGEGCLAEHSQDGITEQKIRETPAGQLGRVGGLHRNSSNILVTAGFPCQPFSVAGKQLSQADDRYLWPQTIAVIKEVKPEWVLLENVTGIINLALDQVLSDLEGAGYATEPLIIPACAVNAWHRRDRVWIVANNANNGFSRPRISIPERRPNQEDLNAGGDSQIVSDTKSIRCQEQCGAIGTRTTWPKSECSSWWSIEPELGRVAHGISSRVDRLKCLGNAIVPQVAYEIIKVIIEIDEGIPQNTYTVERR